MKWATDEQLILIFTGTPLGHNVNRRNNTMSNPITDLLSQENETDMLEALL